MTRRIEDVTAQNMFDDAATHLLTQQKKSMRRIGLRSVLRCAYRGSDQLRCVIGARIPDDEYAAEFEGRSVRVPSVKSRKAAKEIHRRLCAAARIPEQLLRLAVELQDAHDVVEVSEWRCVLLAIANQYGLSTAAVDDVARAKPAKTTK